MAEICLSKTFSAVPDISGTPLVLDEWLPLDLTNLTSASVVRLIGDDEFVRAILEEAGPAIMGEGGGAILEE